MGYAFKTKIAFAHPIVSMDEHKYDFVDLTQDRDDVSMTSCNDLDMEWSSNFADDLTEEGVQLVWTMLRQLDNIPTTVLPASLTDSDKETYQQCLVQCFLKDAPNLGRKGPDKNLDMLLLALWRDNCNTFFEVLLCDHTIGLLNCLRRCECIQTLETLFTHTQNWSSRKSFNTGLTRTMLLLLLELDVTKIEVRFDKLPTDLVQFNHESLLQTHGFTAEDAVIMQHCVDVVAADCKRLHGEALLPDLMNNEVVLLFWRFVACLQPCILDMDIEENRHPVPTSAYVGSMAALFIVRKLQSLPDAATQVPFILRRVEMCVRPADFFDCLARLCVRELHSDLCNAEKDIFCLGTGPVCGAFMILLVVHLMPTASVKDRERRHRLALMDTLCFGLVQSCEGGYMELNIDMYKVPYIPRRDLEQVERRIRRYWNNREEAVIRSWIAKFRTYFGVFFATFDF